MAAIDISKLKFDNKGLIPAIVMDEKTNSVLTLAYMNAESIGVSIDEGRACFWSRSRNELWRKGNTSGNVQQLVSIKTDCDMDALLVTVRKKGPACHTGAESCFFEELHNPFKNAYKFEENIIAEHNAKPDTENDSDWGEPLSLVTKAESFSLDSLYAIIKDRKENQKPGSYTTYLFEKGIDKILKKLGEESTEVIIAGKAADKAQTIFELADLTYHAMVLMTEMSITPDEVINELASRHVEKTQDQTSPSSPTAR